MEEKSIFWMKGMACAAAGGTGTPCEIEGAKT